MISIKNLLNELEAEAKDFKKKRNYSECHKYDDIRAWVSLFF